MINRNCSIKSGNLVSLLMCFVFLFFLTGCQIATSVHLYEGDPLPKDQTARVEIELRERSTLDTIFSCNPSSIQIQHVDGLKPKDFVDGPMVAWEVFVLPGPHTFGIKFRGPNATQAGAIPALIAMGAEELKYGPLGTEITFDAQAGHSYLIRFLEKTEPWKGIVAVAYWVEDINDQVPIMGEKPLDAKPYESKLNMEDKK